MLRTTTLPDPDAVNGADVVIYDGQCNFCRSQVNNLHRLDCCGNRLAFLSLHDPRVQERYPDLSHEDLMEQMYVVDGQDSRHGGADAVRPTAFPVGRIPHFAPAGDRQAVAMDVPPSRQASLQIGG